MAFVSGAAAADGNDAMTTRRRRVGVAGTRGIGPTSMIHNGRLAEVRVQADSGQVFLDGEPIGAEPASSVSLNRLYFL